MINIGVVGVGDLGSIHIEQLYAATNYNVVGCIDPNLDRLNNINQTYSLPTFNSFQELLPKIDALVIASPTTTHFRYAQDAIKKGKHIFIEKPITHTVLQAKELIKLSIESGVVVQIGHLERFNPALLALKNKTTINPRYIDAHRLTKFKQVDSSESLVLDHMIHDIDIVLKMAKANVKKVHASGAVIISDSIDIANARIEFANGCVASLTTSRAAENDKIRMRFFQKESCVSVDLLNKKTDIYKIEQSKNNGFKYTLGNDKGVKLYSPEISDSDAIKLQHDNFYSSITQNNKPEVCAHDGMAALELSYEILKMIQKNIAY